MKFDQFIRYRALAFKFAGQNAADKMAEQAIANSGKVKQVCAPLSHELFEELESMCNLLDISKRKFIEEAIVDALQKAHQIIDEEKVFEGHLEGTQEVTQ